VTEQDVARIESALGISLPAPYRELVTAWPIPALRGNADTEIWDDPDAIIELNRDLRSGRWGAPPWPTHIFAIGSPADPSTRAIDLRRPEVPVWCIDHSRLPERDLGEGFETLASFAACYADEHRAALREDGIDPQATPEQLAKDEESGYRIGKRRVIIALGILAAFIYLALWHPW
jgi:hypothetical protein